MAATERSLPLLGLLVTVVAALGACGDARAAGALPPLPAPAVAGLRLEAEVHPADGGEVRVEATLHLDGDPATVVRLPGGPAGSADGGWAFLAHRRRLPGGGIVLSLGRGGPFDPADPPASPRRDAPPAPAEVEPRLLVGGTSLAGSGSTTRWPADPGDDVTAGTPPSAAEVAAADEVRVCAWGAVGSLASATAPDPPEWEEVVCVDVAGPGP